MSEYDRWEGRYAIPEFLFGREPNYFLAQCAHLLPASGRALAVADGEGRNGVFLAQRGLETVSLDFSPTAQDKARRLAHEAGVPLEIVEADVHRWTYPANAFDVVVEIFTQFSNPAERTLKWEGMKRALKPGGLLIVQGYTPKQLDYGTGGPKQVENLYTEAMLREAFVGFRDMRFQQEELEMHEGVAHGGLSAVIGMTARKAG